MLGNKTNIHRQTVCHHNITEWHKTHILFFKNIHTSEGRLRTEKNYLEYWEGAPRVARRIPGVPLPGHSSGDTLVLHTFIGDSGN